MQLTDAHTLAQLKAINDVTTGAITLFDGSVSLTGTEADVVAALQGISGYSGDVTLTDVAKVAQARAVDAATTGILTLSGGLKDTALAFAAADGTLAAGVAALLALGPAVQLADAHTLAQLKAINDATTGAITLFDGSVSLMGTAADVVAALQGIPGYSGDVTLTDVATVAQLKAINDATTGAITLFDNSAPLTGTAADVATALQGLTDYSGHVTLTDAATVSQARAVNAATTGTLTLSGGLKDTALAFAAADGALAAGVAALLALGPAVQLTDAHNLAQLKAINTATSGAITLFNKSVPLTGTATDVVVALQGIFDYNGRVTMTDAPTIAQAQAVNALTTGTLTLSGGLKDAVLKFAGTDGTLTAGAATLLALGPAVQLTDVHNLAQLKAINNATTGLITLFNKSVALTGLYADILAALNGITDYAGNVTLTDVVTVAQAKIMDNSTVGFLTMSGGLKDSGLNLVTADGIPAPGVSELLVRNPAVEFTDATTVLQWQAVDSITNGAVSGNIHDTVLAANGLNFSASDWSGVKGVVLTGSIGNQVVTGSAFADILSGGSGADVLSGGGGADIFVYTEAGQGGAALAGSATTALSAGDTINYVFTDNDKIDLSAITSGKNTFLENSFGTWNLGFSGLCIISSVALNYQQGVTTAAQVSTAIGRVYSSGNEVGYAAILDNQGNGDPSDDVYVLFEISLSGPHLGSPIGPSDTISLLGVINSNTLSENSFVL